jgi:hypothetical protein
MDLDISQFLLTTVLFPFNITTNEEAAQDIRLRRRCIKEQAKTPIAK